MSWRMRIDARKNLSVETVQEIEAAYLTVIASVDEDGRPNRNAVRRYRRKIRAVSGQPRVTCHFAEHNPQFNPPTKMVVFGHRVE